MAGFSVPGLQAIIAKEVPRRPKGPCKYVIISLGPEGAPILLVYTK